jgi:hypothetical protein
MDYLDVLTMTTSLEIDGENNIYRFYLLYMHQYQFTDQMMRYRKVDDVGDGGLDTGGDPRPYVLHYKVVADDGLDYCWIPSIYTAIENKLRTPEQQDSYLRNMNRVSDQPRDVVKAYKDITGKDLDKFNRQEMHNGFELYKRYLKEMHKNNGKIYGKTTESL